MSLLTAVEYITPDPARRVALYKCEDRNTAADDMNQDDPQLLNIGSSVAKDLASLERRARQRGFRSKGEGRNGDLGLRTVEDGFGHGRVHRTRPVASTG
jgi:hypothetical protein